MGKFKDLELEDLDVKDALASSLLSVKIKKFHKDAVIPSYAKPGDAGLDLTAVDSGKNIHDRNGFVRQYRTGIGVEIPEGYVGLVFPRSSIYKYGISLTNCVGVIDSGYRGEILANFRIVSQFGKVYDKGDRIAQLMIMPYPKVQFEEVDNLEDSERSTGGFGSTGD